MSKLIGFYLVIALFVNLSYEFEVSGQMDCKHMLDIFFTFLLSQDYEENSPDYGQFKQHFHNFQAAQRTINKKSDDVVQYPDSDSQKKVPVQLNQGKILFFVSLSIHVMCRNSQITIMSTTGPRQIEYWAQYQLLPLTNPETLSRFTAVIECGIKTRSTP
jgi:hypothetical protein